MTGRPTTAAAVPPYRPFTVSFGDHTLAGDLLSVDSCARVLVLHGAGEQGRKRVRFIRERMFAAGVSSCSFDFIGHGETGGNLKATSLEDRTRQACRIIEACDMLRPLRIVAASMGAYTAVKLLEYHPVQALVLLVPAMYAQKAYRVAFGGGFSQLIREPNSWEHSDAWSLLEGYTGRLMVVAAEKDPVIPRGVIMKICAASKKAWLPRLYTAPDAPHAVFTHMRSESPDALERVLDQIHQLLAS